MRASKNSRVWCLGDLVTRLKIQSKNKPGNHLKIGYRHLKIAGEVREWVIVYDLYNEHITRFWCIWRLDTRNQAIKSIRPIKKQYTGRNKPISTYQSLLDTNCMHAARTYPSKNTCKTAVSGILKINTRHQGAGDPGTIN